MYRSRLILLAVLVVGASMLVVQAVSAYGMHRGAGLAMMSMDKLTKALNLTPDQVIKIQAIHQNARAQRQAVVADKSLAPEAKKAKLMEIFKATHEQVIAVLTPEQRAKFKELRDARKAEMFGKMSVALGLTADQQEQIKAIRDSEKADLVAVRGDTTLTPDARAAKVREIRMAAREKFRGVLTPEQLAKLDALHKGHKAGRVGAGPKRQPACSY